MSREPSPRDVDCPPAPDGCAASPGEPCLSHGGTRVRRTFHQARTAAWNQARSAANPADALIQRAAQERRSMHAKHAVQRLEEHGFTAEAALVQRAVKDRNGLMSARQAARLLLDRAEGGGI